MKYEILADAIGSKAGWPTQIEMIADDLALADPSFNKEKFIRRAVKAWEDTIPELEDEIMF